MPRGGSIIQVEVCEFRSHELSSFSGHRSIKGQTRRIGASGRVLLTVAPHRLADAGKRATTPRIGACRAADRICKANAKSIRVEFVFMMWCPIGAAATHNGVDTGP